MMADKIFDQKLNRGGSSEAEQKIYGVQFSEDVVDTIARELSEVRTDLGASRDILDILPHLPTAQYVDLRSEVDAMYGEGVSRCLDTLGIRLTSAIACSCGKLGRVTSLQRPNMVCAIMTDACHVNTPQFYQDIQPNLVANAVGYMTGHIGLGTNYYFIEMLGALAGYPFRCNCGNPISCLDAPLTICDICASTDGVADFIKHMDAPQNDVDVQLPGQQADPPSRSFVERVCAGIGIFKDKAKNTGTYVYGLIAELITTVGNYFNSVFEHYGSHFFEGMKTSFRSSISSIIQKLREHLGGVGVLFLFVAVVVATVVKFGAGLVANFIISTTLSLFEMLKDVGEQIFVSFLKVYQTINDALKAREEREEDDCFTKHSANSDGCISMIATLFCTFASTSGAISSTNILRAISSARHVVSGMQVAKSALLWLVEGLPVALQTYLWDMTGLGNFDCDDEHLQQLIVVMRESLLLLRKDPNTFLADPTTCRTLLTSHTMLTRAVTKNLHGWNSTQNSILRAMLAESKEYISRAQSCADRGTSSRVEPIGLILQGPPGIGKTGLIEVLAGKLNPDIPRCARIYYKNPREKFWSGYSAQPVLVMDDYGAVKDEQLEAGLAADLLRIISPGDMPLDMPFEKGTVFCKSNLVVLTTNRDMNAPQKFLTCNRAFMRRFIYCTVSIIPEYTNANGQLDTAKLKALPIEESIKFPHLRFRIHEEFRDGPESAGLYNISHQDRTLDELMTVIEAFIVKKEADAGFLENVANVVAPEVDDTVAGRLLGDEIKLSLDDQGIEPFEKHMDPAFGIDYGNGLNPVERFLKTGEHKTSTRDVIEHYGQQVPVVPSQSLPGNGHDIDNPVESPMFQCSNCEHDNCNSIGVDVEALKKALLDCDSKEDREAAAEVIEDIDREIAAGMVDHIESEQFSAVSKPIIRPKWPKTKSGNKAGKNTRDKVRAQFEESRARKQEVLQQRRLPGSHYDEFGLPWRSPDLALRAAAYLNANSKIVHAKTMSLREHSERFKKMICETAMEVLATMKDNPMKCLASVVACAGTIGMCIKAFKLVSDPATEPQMRTKYNMTDTMRRRPDVAHRRRFAPLVKHSLDSETDKGVVNKISANCGFLERQGGRVGCFFVAGNVFRTVLHFFRTSETSDKWLPDGTPFSLFAREGDEMVEYKMSFSMDFVVPFEDDNGLLSDWVYYSCGTKVPPKKDLTNFHVKEKIFAHRRDFRSVMLIRHDSVSRGTTSVVRSIANSPAVQYSSVDGSRKHDVYVPTAIMSNYNCDHGDCGYPLVGKVDGQYKILALHVGIRSRPFGNESTSAVVTLGEVNDCLGVLNRDFPIVKHAALADVKPSRPAVALNDAYSYLGKLEWAPKGISDKTKYKRSLIYNQLEKKTIYEPSIMGHAEDVRTSKNAKEVLADIANRADSSLSVMPKHLVKLAEDALFESVVTQIPRNDDTVLRTLSLDEALNGDGKMVDRYPTAGSPGIPSTLTRKHGVTGKHGIMSQNAEGNWYISDPDCAERIDELHEGFSDGVVKPYFNQFCMKDETLKTDANGQVKKTRGIKCAPIEANLCGKRYFGSMICLFKKFFDKIPFKCGINVFSSDWDDLIKWHLEVGDTGFDGDIGGQENIIKGEIYDALYRFTNRIYEHYGEKPTEQEKRQRAAYLTSLCHYYMVLGPDLFRAKFGNPSGNWLTAFICSFTSGILLGVAYFGLALKHDPMKANVYSFLSFTRMSLCGDDNLVSRSSLIPWFSGCNVSAFLQEHFGYKYTDAKKAEVFPEDRDVVMLNFLACSTRLSDKYPTIRYMACIDPGPLEKCVQYVSSKAADGDEYVAIVDNANTALDLVWTSGKERFNEYRDKYLKAFVATPDCNVPVLHDFNYCETRFLNKELLSEDYFADDYKFIPHMLKAPEQVKPVFEDAQVTVEAGPETKTDSFVTYKTTERTVLEPAKRFSVMYHSEELKTPVAPYTETVSSAFVTRPPVSGDFRPMAGALAYYAGPFAAWSGDLRLGFKCAGEVLIRTDATERLASASTLPKQIGKAISSMSPFDYTSAGQQWAMLQIPNTMRFKWLVLPKLPGEEDYAQTTSATYIVDTPNGAGRPSLTTFAAAGDNFTLHFLFMVPSLKVGTAYYTHNRNYQDTLPEYVKLVHVAGATAFPFAQASVILNYKEQGVVESTGTIISSINYRTEVFNDVQLVSLGIVTTAPTNRRYDPGAVREVECDMSRCTARSINVEVQPGGTSSGAASFGLDPTTAVVRGTSYSFSGIEMASGWYLTYPAYDNALVRTLLNGTGIPTTEIVIPAAQSGFQHSPAESFIKPTTDTPVGYVGGSLFTWDSTTTFPKAFYDTAILPFMDQKESKEEYTFVKHMDSDHGIGFSNVVDAPVVATDREPRVARKGMGEEKYSFDTLADRVQLIKSFQWTADQVQGTVLDSRSVPYQCIGNTTKTAFEKFCYWAGDVEIKVQVQSTAFVCGKLIVVFAPLCDPVRASQLQLPSLVSMSVAPNVTIMAGNTTEVTMLIPYAHYKNYLNTDGESGDPFSLLGTVSIVVFNQLKVASGGIDYCTVNVYSRFRNSNFQMLRPPVIPGNVPVVTTDFVKHGGVMSVSKNVTGVIDDVTDAVDRVGAVAEYALDKPNVGVNYTPVFGRAAPMMNHSRNVQFLNVMDFDPGQSSLADEKDVASAVAECTLKYLLTKPSYLNTFAIKVSDLEGKVYMVMPLTPTMKLFNAPMTSMVDESLMGYTAAPFKFWRGGFKLVIEVIATSIHTARLVVATHYGGASSTVNMENILAQNAEVLEIGAGQNTFEVIVPWRAPTQWLEVPGGPPDQVNPFEVTSSARYSMGEVSIRLLTRLQSMPSVTDEIDCNIYVSMLDDAEVAYIGMNTADLTPVFVPNQDIVPP